MRVKGVVKQHSQFIGYPIILYLEKEREETSVDKAVEEKDGKGQKDKNQGKPSIENMGADEEGGKEKIYMKEKTKSIKK